MRQTKYAMLIILFLPSRSDNRSIILESSLAMVGCVGHNASFNLLLPKHGFYEIFGTRTLLKISQSCELLAGSYDQN